MMMQGSLLRLLRLRRFAPFFLTQFLGAFNDNLFRNALLIMIAFRGAAELQANSHLLVNLAAGLFILPFFLFSATAGQLADKFEKSRLIRLIKAMEILIMGMAAAAFISGSVPLLIGLLFLMGTQSAAFGPVKYAIMPQHLRDDELVAGNGLVEMGTFLAILLGTLAGGLLIGISATGAHWVAGLVVVLALLGYSSARAIPEAPPPAPDLRINWNPVTETWATWQFTRRNRTVLLSILGISWFWFVGAVYLAQFPNYARNVLGGNEQVVTLLLTLFALGIGTGSLLCERMSGRRVELGLVPFGSIGMTVFGIDLFFAAPGAFSGATLHTAASFAASPGGWRVMLDLLLIGMFGGFYIVPLYALVQQRSEPSRRSRIIAGNNILNALFMVAAALISMLLLGVAGLGIPQLFLLMALANAVVALYIYTLVPEFLMRFVVWLGIHLAYLLQRQGLEHIPEEGAAVLVCNHVSYVDALVLAGACRRPMRFVMYHRIYKIPVLNFLFRAARAIPIASAKEDPAMLVRAYDEVSAALANGELVCLFPEGKLTADGEIDQFRSGIERIVARNPVPVIPMALQGLWGGFFSHCGGRAMCKWPRRAWTRISLAVGAPVPPEQVSAEQLHAAVSTLAANISSNPSRRSALGDPAHR